MPILQEINDPYYASTSSALGGMADGMIGNPAKSQAEAIALASQVQLRRMQQQKLEQEMAEAKRKAEWELSDRNQSQAAQDAAGRYWGYATPAPVNGTPQDMERYYREQNYRDQTARLMARSGKGAEDIAKGFNDYQTGFNAAHPVAVEGTPNAAPAGIAGNPVAEKKYFEENAKNVADQRVADEKSRKMAAQILPQILQSRDAYHNASVKGGVGKIIGSDFGRLNTALGFGQTNADRAAAQDNYEKAAAFWQSRQIAANNQGLGAMSNYEQQLARQPFAKLNDVNEQVGIDAIDRQIAYNLQTLGVPGGLAPKVVAALTSGRVPKDHYDMLVRDLQAGDMASLQEFLDHYGVQ